MARPQDKLAESLEVLRTLMARGVVAIRAADLTRVHRERLLRNGYLQMVMKGWYIPVRPDEAAGGESTTWYASFWDFCAAYLRIRFGVDWCLSPEQSLLLHGGNRNIPAQLVVRSPKGGNKATDLLHGTSLLDLRLNPPAKEDVVEKDGLRLYSLPASLVACSAGVFERTPIEARTALAQIRDASQVLDLLLKGEHSAIAGRLAGAFRNIGRDRIADDILKTMRAAGYAVREQDPFKSRIVILEPRLVTSPFAVRVRLMWQQLRTAIPDVFPASPGPVRDADAYLNQVQDAYVTDAYHSLSIEGYRVSPNLIERVRGGGWDPDTVEEDREHHDALAARGYWLAFEEVRKSLLRVLQGDDPGRIAEDDHGTWYRELFAPCVTAGLMRSADLAGYRNRPVFIRQSMHVPPNHEAVRDMMPVFFEMLREESEPSVRVVLGHFLFVYIHPYSDGNGRIGRFLMNVMLAAGGYPWTILPVEKRDAYMAALEDAGVRQNIIPLAEFLARLVRGGTRKLHGMA
jgi:hypothetical protein